MANPKQPRSPGSLIKTLADSGNHPVTAQTLFMGACEYGRAAWMLAGSPWNPVIPFAQFVAQSIELALKAYVMFQGGNEADIRAINHNLERAWEECRNRGLDVQFPIGWLQGLNMHYGDPFLYRYWRQGLGWGCRGRPGRQA
jgi:hypothetical protein